MTDKKAKKKRTQADPMTDPLSGKALALSVIYTIQESIIILDRKLNIIAASPSFYKEFGLTYPDVTGSSFFELCNGQFDIPSLRKLLEEIIPSNKTVENYEVDCDFDKLGKRIMNINAREIDYNTNDKKMLISIFDITEQRRLERDRENLGRQKDILIKEMRHRIANSLQIIASILLLKAQEVTSEESRSQLEDVHDRIMSIATVQGHLDPEGLAGATDVRTYLNKLCKELAQSMIGDRRPLTIKVKADDGKVTTDEAVGIGLITTELIINSIKHAFNPNKEGEIVVSYESAGMNWKLTIQDNGSGMTVEKLNNRKGLGTGIVNTLVEQMKAKIETQSTPDGTMVTITRETPPVD